MKKIKFISLMLVIIMVATVFYGCGSSKDADQAKTGQETQSKTAETTEITPKQPVTVKFVSNMTLGRDLSEVIKEYNNEESLINVEVVTHDDSSYREKVAVQLAGGSDYDLICNSNNADYSSLALKNQYLALDELIKKDQVDISGFGPLYEGVKINGKVFGLPITRTTWVLFYNKNLFDAAKEPYPKADMTWSEFRNLAKKMTSGEGAEKIWGAHFHTWPVCWFGTGLQTGATIVDEDLSPFKDALQLRLDLENDGSIMKYTDQIATSVHYRAAFVKGNVAMNIIGDWHIGQLREDEEKGALKFDWDIQSLPHPDKVSSNTSWGMPATASMNNASKYKDEAWDVLKYVVSEEAAKIWASHAVLPGFMNGEIKSVILEKSKGKKPVNIGMLTEQKVYVEYPPLEGINEIAGVIYNEESQLAFAGEKTVDEVIASIKKRIQEMAK